LALKKVLLAALAATTALTGVMSSGVAAAQPAYHRDRDHDGVPNAYDRHDDRRDDRRDYRRDGYRGDRHDDRRDERRSDRQFRYYGGNYGYNGYHGRWRTGQRYTHWRDNRYVVNDWRAYNLPPPRTGYRYYRDDNGDVVMAAIASGAIGLILGGALSH
jgi:Ni/Co efflux regulator RcnB